LAYGAATGALRGSADAARMMAESLASMAPVLVMCFFAAQFLKYFEYSNLGRMMAMAGGKALASSGLGPGPLMVALVLVIMLFNLLVTSASAKWAVFASIFVPMLMMVGISPALTQAAFRVGDSTTNIIAPLNAYLVVVLAVMQKYAPRSGLGTLMALMLPYSLAFGAAWIALLLLWMQTGASLGPGGPLTYLPR
jgi:aminobenzoyl-glutamate transport protein